MPFLSFLFSPSFVDPYRVFHMLCISLLPCKVCSAYDAMLFSCPHRHKQVERGESISHLGHPHKLAAHKNE